MRELSLFSGAGGGLLGTKLLGWRTVGYVEWNEYCQRVIAARIADGYLDCAPIFGDVRKFVQSGAARQYRGFADVVTGGFPCQPFSVAGKQQAADDERNMWPATRDCIRDVQPRSVLLENVPGLVSCGYLGTVITDLAALGYVGKWGVIGAADCGAPHQRDRLWIVAHASSEGPQFSEFNSAFVGWPTCRSTPQSGENGRNRNVGDSDLSRLERTNNNRQLSGRIPAMPSGSSSEMANSGSIRLPRSWWSFDPGNSTPSSNREADRTFYESRWGIESQLGRVANGVAHRVDRLKAIGNGQVSAVVARAWAELA